MKRFKYISALSCGADGLVVMLPLLLIVPNVALAFTEQDAVMAKIADICLPLGIYYLCAGISTNIGRTTLLCLPLMIFAAFQIVLLYLYGESIIAVDMFLNVVTTNTEEVAELLGNLLMAIILIVIIYLPPIIHSSYLLYKRIRSSARAARISRKCGMALAAAGLFVTVLCHFTVDRYSIRRNIFPVNVISNMFEAANRTIATRCYHDTSSSFSYRSESTHDPEMKEAYVLIIGETSRADNWQMFGYDRETNPKLSRQHDVVVFPKTLSESNTTHKSVPMIMSPLTASNFGDSICLVKGIVTAFNEAGFRTAFFSNQQRNHSFIDFFGMEANVVDFIRDHHDGETTDRDLSSRLKQFLRDYSDDKLFIILHTYGSHFNYKERYCDGFSRFVPDEACEATEANRRELVNAYDNSIIATDAFIDDIIHTMDGLGIPAALIYVSDHGEDIFDDKRCRFLHASPTPTFMQIHVPLLIWASRSYTEMFPEKIRNAECNSDKNVSSSRSVFDTMLSIAGISTHLADHEKDLCSPLYREPRRIYLNDYNEAVDLVQAGLKDFDFDNAHKSHISTN